MITAHRFILPFKREGTLQERYSWYFHAWLVVNQIYLWGMNDTEVEHFVETLPSENSDGSVGYGYQNLWLHNSPCLNVNTAPSKSRRKDNSALLEMCQRRSGAGIVQVPWNSEMAHFRQSPHRQPTRARLPTPSAWTTSLPICWKDENAWKDVWEWNKSRFTRE